VTLASQPRLAARARLRFDRHARQWLLLYPERGLALNAQAGAIAQLLTGEHSVDAIVTRLLVTFPAAARATIEQDVFDFLKDLAARRLLEDDG
jgi:coenzyme PQQ biosynthesis protein PqqD